MVEKEWILKIQNKVINMEKEYYSEKVMAKLIANTRRRKRHDNLVEIARQIRWLENDLGGLKEVSEKIGISRDQLHQFLSVEKLSPEVKKLVENRKIDSINTVHYMRNFSHKAQKVIANEVINKRLSPSDIRVIAPLRLNKEQQNIKDIISRVRNAKNVRLYVLYFQVPRVLQEGIELNKAFGQIIGEGEIYSFKVEGSRGILEVTEVGKAKLRDEAKRRKLTLKKLINEIVKVTKEMKG